jgi:glycerol uptake facilitator-like aquaporin
MSIGAEKRKQMAVRPDAKSTSTGPTSTGPSSRIIAWRNFLAETTLCVVLIAVIVVFALSRANDILIGSTIATLAGIILGVLWRHG